MVSLTKPSTDTSILEQVARVVSDEPEKLSSMTHDDQRIGPEKIADIFTWEIPSLGAEIIVTVPAGSSAFVDKRRIAEVPLGAIQVLKGDTVHKYSGLRACDKRMLNFGRSGKIHGLAAAIRAINHLTAGTGR